MVALGRMVRSSPSCYPLASRHGANDQERLRAANDSSGSLVSGGSRDRSSLQAKNRTNGRRFKVPWSRIVPRSTG